MKNKILKIFLLTMFLILIFITKVEATPGNKDFVDELFYQSIIDTLNNTNYNNINDRNINYVVTEDELKSVKTLFCGDIDNKIYDLKGLEKLINLENFSVYYSDIYDIDISQNTKLKNIEIVNANNIKHVDFSNNIELQSINLTYTHLEELNVENCPKLMYLVMGAGNTQNATIQELDLSNCNELIYLSFGGNKLRNLDLSQNEDLEYLCVTSGTLEEIILPENSQIETLSLYDNNIKTIYDIKNIETDNNLRKVYIQENYIEDCDFLYENEDIEDLLTYKKSEDKVYNTYESDEENIGRETHNNIGININTEKLKYIFQNLDKMDKESMINLIFFGVLILLSIGLRIAFFILPFYIIIKLIKANRITPEDRQINKNYKSKYENKTEINEDAIYKNEYEYRRSEKYYNDLSGRDEEDKRL